MRHDLEGKERTAPSVVRIFGITSCSVKYSANVVEQKDIDQQSVSKIGSELSVYCWYMA